MSKLDELIQEYCPDGVEYKKLGECCVISAGGDIPKNRFSKNCTEEYRVPIISNGIGKNAIYGYTDSPKITNDAVTISARGTIGYAEYRDYPFYPIVRLLSLIPDNKCLNPKFLYYVLQGRKYNVPETGIPQLTAPCIKKELIPLPPLTVQEEIVRILDNFTELTENLNIELTARKKQYEYYREKILDFDENKTPIVLITDLCEIGDGLHGTPKYDNNGDYYFINGNNLANGRIIYDDKTKKVSFDEYNRIKTNLEKAILFSINGTIGNIAIYNNEKIVLGKSVAYFNIVSPNLLLKYLFYYLQVHKTMNYFENHLTGSTIKNLGLKALRNLKIPLPSLETQKRIVHVLDNFEKICSDLNIGLPAEIEARQKQYEYYRDALLTFAAKGDIIVNRTEQNRTEQNRTEQNRTEQNTSMS